MGYKPSHVSHDLSIRKILEENERSKFRLRIEALKSEKLKAELIATHSDNQKIITAKNKV